MSSPLISVVVPVYNGQNTLRQCLDSVLEQSFKNYEVVVVDNNSTDESKSIIKEYELKNKNLRYVFEEHQTRGSSRNSGIRNSNAEVIVMTDQDCIVPVDWIEKITQPILEENESIVMGSEFDVTNDRWSSLVQEEQIKQAQSYRRGKYINILDTKNWAVKRNVILEYMFDDQMLNVEDIELTLRIRTKEKIRYLPELKVGHFHKSTLFGCAKLNFLRGIWMQKIYYKYKNGGNLKTEPSFEGFSFRNLCLFPCWALWQFSKKPFERALFLLLSGISWRIGILIGKLRFKWDSI